MWTPEDTDFGRGTLIFSTVWLAITSTTGPRSIILLLLASLLPSAFDRPTGQNSSNHPWYYPPFQRIIITMSSNNKNSKNNKKTTSSKTNQQSSTPAEISSFVHSGKVDAKRLARKLPDVAAAVRSGSLQPEDVPRVARQANEDHLMAELSKHLPEELLNGCGKKIHRIGGLEIMTGAEHLLCDLVRVACGSDENLSYAFAADFFGGKECPWKYVREKIHMEGTSITECTPEDCAVIFEIQQAYNRACEKWRFQIEKLVRKPMEEHCWAYTKSPFEFMQVVGQLIYRDENSGIQELCRDLAYSKSIQVDHKVEAAARGVAAGHDTIRHQCWECGKDSVPVSKCSRCEAARYCSKECQAKSWKDGHRGACGELKTMYQQFLTNYRRIDQALQVQNEENSATTTFGPDGRTLPPAGSKDYMLLPMLLSNYTFPVTLNVDIVRNGCTSIDHLYKNLADIVRGRNHWMFEDTFPCTIQEYVTTHTLERANAVEMDYMLQGLLFLTVDISKIPPSAVHVAVNLFRLQLRKSTLDAELMPVTRFIEIYYRFGLGEREGYEDPGARLKELAKCVTLMMKHFHKKKASFDMVDSLMKEVNDMRGWPKVLAAATSDSN